MTKETIERIRKFTEDQDWGSVPFAIKFGKVNCN